MSTLLWDIRRSVRRLVGVPVFTVTVVFTVALGIGGTTAVFTLVQGVLLDPLPYPEPHELVRIRTHIRGQQWGFSVADYLALEEQQTSFEQVALFRNRTVTFTGGDRAERVRIRRVTPSFFTILAVRPQLGRLFTAEEGEPGGGAVAILSHGFWQRQMGGDPAVIGQTVNLDGQEHTVVGVLPRDVGPLEHGRELFTALQLETPPRKGPFFYLAIARLRPDVERGAAAAELRAINDRIFPIWQDSWPQRESTWAMEDLKESVVGDVGTALFVITGAVLLVLLIACTNAANLLVARGVQRRHELAVRAALGASRARLLRLLLSEAVVLAAAGAGFGLMLAFAGMRAATSLGANFIPRTNEIQFDGPALLFFVGITLVSVALFGLVPSLQSSAAEPREDLRSGGRGGTTTLGAQRLRRALVAAQFAVTTPLLIGAALLLVTMTRLGSVDPGFDPERVLTAIVHLPRASYAEREQRRSLWNRALERIRAIPGVEAAGVGSGRPPDDYDGFGNNFVVEGRPLAEGEAQPTVPWLIVTPEYFDAYGVRLLEGRMFDLAADSGLGDFVAIVDRSWAQRFFPRSSAVGRRFRSGSCTQEGCSWRTVIGVVEDLRFTGLHDAGEGTMYISHERFPVPSGYLVVRTATEPLSLLPALRNVIREAEPAAPITHVATGTELIRDSLEEPRYLTMLVAVFAGVALVLSLVGIYGVMTYFVQHHRRDIGIRLALGGAPSDVAGRVFGSGVRLAAFGTLVGIGAALLLTRFLSNLLFEIQANDPITFGGVAAGLIGVAFLACFLPARRAAQVDPAMTLRQE